MPVLVHPVAVSHRGLSIVFACELTSTGVHASVQYNVLDPAIASPDDVFDWSGFRTLTFPPQLAFVGMSVARQTRAAVTSGLFQVVSDQTYVYVFRASADTIYANRYRLTQQPDPRAGGDPIQVLQPAWEVRYQRSGKADLPLSDKDTPGARDMDGQPYLEPVYELPLSALSLGLTSFAIQLEPASTEGGYRWQLFVPDAAGGRVLAYSFGHGPDAWLSIDPGQLDPARAAVLPDAALTLDHDHAPVTPAGPPALLNYLRQEPVLSEASPVLKMARSMRALLALPVTTKIGAGVATLDFAVGSDGRLAGLAPTGRANPIAYHAGIVTSAPFVLAFDGVAAVHVPTTTPAGPLRLPKTFSIEVWVFPAGDQLEPQVLVGGDPDLAAAAQAPTLAIVDKLRVQISFGDGTRRVAATTAQNVLALGTWSHVCAVHGDAGFAIYVNGAAVALAEKAVPHVTPSTSPITSLGASAAFVTSRVRGAAFVQTAGTSAGFRGRLDELRVWSVALTADDIAAYLYQEIPQAVVDRTPALIAYWRLDDAAGTTAVDLTRNDRRGTLAGARWEPSTSPVAPGTEAQVYFDARSLATYVGLIVPDKEHPAFGDVAAGSRPCLLASADGLVHLYYRGHADHRFYAAQYDATIERAIYGLPWKAGAGKTPESGWLALVARQSGAVMNRAEIQVAPAASSVLCDVTLADGLGTVETWTGVPLGAAALAAVLGGQAIAQPTDLRVRTGAARFYDYGGTRPVGLLPQPGEPPQALGFASARTAGFCAVRVAFGAIDGDRGDLTLTISSDADHPAEELSCTIGGLPTDAGAFIKAVNGGDPAAVARPGGAQLFALPATPSALSVFIPAQPAVSAPSFTVTPSTPLDPTRCDLAIALTCGTRALAASWRALPRASGAFLAALRASTEPDQKAILEVLRFLDPGAATVQDGISDRPAPAGGFLALVAVFDAGWTGRLPPFSLPLTRMQGASSNRAGADLTGGSEIFAVPAPAPPTSGSPALIDLAAGDAATTLRPGRDGGWTPEPPRQAVRFPGSGGGALHVATTTDAVNALRLDGDLTLEAWAQMTETLPGPADYSARIIHARLGEGARDARYALGLVSGYTLQCSQHTLVTVNDDHLGDGAERLRLFPSPGTDYSIQMYVRPDRSTPADVSVLFKRFKGPYAFEQLWIAGDGTLTYTIQPVFGEEVSSPPSTVKVLDGAWQQITVTRTSKMLTVYLDAQAVTSIAKPPSTFTGYDHLSVGGDETTPTQPMEVNQFALWTRALTAGEIADALGRPLAPDARGLQLLWGLDERLPEEKVRNTATATAGHYDTRAHRPVRWDYPGLFARAFFACRDRAVVTRGPVAAYGEWHGYAGRYAPTAGVRFDGDDHCDCGDDRSLNVRDELTVEAWAWPDVIGGAPQTLVSKWGAEDGERSYHLGLDATGRVSFRVRVDGMRTSGGDAVAERLRVLPFVSPRPLVAGVGRYLAATFAVESTVDAATGKVLYSPVGQLYLDGVPQLDGPAKVQPVGGTAPTYVVRVLGGSGSGRYPKGTKVTIAATDTSSFTAWRGQTDPVASTTAPTTTLTVDTSDVTVTAVGGFDRLTLTSSSTAVNLGRTAPADGERASGYYRGGLAEVRIWSNALSPQVIADAYRDQVAPPKEDGLLSSWSFTEQTGRVAFDGNLDNNARLSNGVAWTRFHDSAQLTIGVDGHLVPIEPIDLLTLGEYGKVQVRFGASRDKNDVARNPFTGVLDEIRVWNRVRTPEQLADDDNRYLTGREDGLVAYWRFDAGSGAVVADATGRGNDARFETFEPDGMPGWVPSTAPVSNEAPEVENALGGLHTSWVATLDEGPAVFEYADTQLDAAGNVFAVMKRGSAYVSGGRLRLQQGYKVGDLRRVFVGQVQTRPTLIGYIEGAPPVPSENLTRPYYLDTISSYFQYDGIARINLTETASTQVTLRSSERQHDAVSSDLCGGVSGDRILLTGTAAVGVALTQSVKHAWKAGTRATVESSEHDAEGQALGAAVERSAEYSLGSGGDWEAPEAPLLVSGERRFEPANEGLAIVKSSTADMYALYLESTGALVALSVVPSGDIPEDVNLISFPIRTDYVHNGSLDGRIGLQDDPASRGAPSYFRPREAYALQRRIEWQTAAVDAWYAELDAKERGENQQEELGHEENDHPLYDWRGRAPRKDMMNKYVWSAGGGLYREQEGYTSMRSESYSGGYELAWRLGTASGGEVEVGSVGLFFEADALHGRGWSIEVEKSKEASSAIELDVTVAPESCLLKFNGVDAVPPYSRAPVPGKVDTYRFMTFYLSPATRNTSAFFEDVVDDGWLKTSDSPAATALREAQGLSAGSRAWRVMHRVTFVGRVPPTFQPVPVVSSTPPVAPPANLEGNALVLALVARRLHGVRAPTPVQLGAAVHDVLHTDLVTLVPWWAHFLRKAALPNTTESVALRTITADTLRYAGAYHETAGG